MELYEIADDRTSMLGTLRLIFSPIKQYAIRQNSVLGNQTNHNHWLL